MSFQWLQKIPTAVNYPCQEKLPSPGQEPWPVDQSLSPITPPCMTIFKLLFRISLWPVLIPQTLHMRFFEVFVGADQHRAGSELQLAEPGLAAWFINVDLN